MEIVVHRANTVAELEAVPPDYGAEIDIRVQGRELILHHEPYQTGERLSDYLDHYRHGLLVLNIKSDGIEDDVVEMVQQRGIARYFLLDVEFPYISRSSRRAKTDAAIRYSEDEDIATVKNFIGKAEWVWIDCVTHLPLTATIVEDLKPFKTCLVCPERWGRPGDIPVYQEQMRSLGFEPDAVMTAIGYAPAWIGDFKTT
ncbi:MAG: hypothetical protein O2923_12515 [Verrucomicrobia bacterium]|nr:hypothetical protein [Verrucomicrobiota bacterium]MDA1086695.1 hypothetical protein [Verrucomicrobiota bacterium]